MSGMHRFYTALCHGLEVYNPDLAPLIQLTQVSPAQVRELTIGLAWADWPAAIG